jgi:lipoprotein-anchoring transpeptidase ErfK/SrfK
VPGVILVKRAVKSAVCMSLAALACAAYSRARADSVLPPWSDPGDVPLPPWARSVVPQRAETPVVTAPGQVDPRRGTTLPGVRLPFYGAKRAQGCLGRWLLVGPLAWICSDAADLSADEPFAPPLRHEADGLPYRYFFVAAGGAYAFLNLDSALDDAPDQELDPGFGVAMVEEREAHGERWGLTRHGRWIAMRELVAARAVTFHGESSAAGSAVAAGSRDAVGSGDAAVDDAHALDVAWVRADAASVYSAPKASGKPVRALPRFAKVMWREERAAAPGGAGAGGGSMVRISEDGVVPTEWARARDLAHPTLSVPPDEVGGTRTTERWIDVDLATQTLVAYDATHPVYATLISSGRGPAGSDTATPLGVHRIWVKLSTTNMGNLEKDDAEPHYSIEDVPYVQFFDKGVALHGAFWHRDFGRVHSHGCVNLAPRDAQWLFDFTAPHLPAGWSAVLPSPLERGTAVRVR